MFSRKSKVLTAPPPPPRHSFRMRAIGTEFEAHGLGLVVALFAVLLILTAIVFGGAATTQAVGSVFDRITQPEPETASKPPK